MEEIKSEEDLRMDILKGIANKNNLIDDDYLCLLFKGGTNLSAVLSLFKTLTISNKNGKLHLKGIIKDIAMNPGEEIMASIKGQVWENMVQEYKENNKSEKQKQAEYAIGQIEVYKKLEKAIEDLENVEKTSISREATEEEKDFMEKVATLFRYFDMDFEVEEDGENIYLTDKFKMQTFNEEQLKILSYVAREIVKEDFSITPCAENEDDENFTKVNICYLKEIK